MLSKPKMYPLSSKKPSEKKRQRPFYAIGIMKTKEKKVLDKSMK